MKPKPPEALFAELQGEQLSAVTFVQDYLQLWFDGPGINVTSPLTVEDGEAAVTSWHAGFRDLLCAQIAKRVARVEFRAEQALVVYFTDGARLTVSLRREDCTSPEAFVAHGFKDNQWFFA